MQTDGLLQRSLTPLVLVSLLIGGGCRPMPKLEPDQVRVEGTVRHINIEGGCWVFEASDGNRFQLTSGAPDSLLVDGKRATVVLRKRTGLMTTCQAGIPAQVVKVER